MSNDLNNTFKLIKKTIDKKEDSRPNLYVVPKAELVEEFINSETNNHIVEEFITETKEKYTFEFIPAINDNEVRELLNTLKSRYDSERLIVLVNECKASVMDAIIRPFGLAGILFDDKDGGNVDTIHNVRNKDKRYNDGSGIYSTDTNKQKYENKPDYDSGRYHKHENYIRKNKQDSESKENGILEDAYRGRNIKRNDNVDLDHTISAKEIDEDPGRVLAGLDGADLANTDSNLNTTDRSINRSKKQKSVDEYIKYLEATKSERLERIKELTSIGSISDKERKELNKLNKMEKINVDMLKQKDEEARREYEKKINQTYYTSKEFVSNVGKTSAKEGLKMGMQQAIGLLVREFALAVFSESKDIFSNRHSIKLNTEFLQSLKERFERISRRVMSKWEDVVFAFGSGVISGFFSNMINVIINSFLTTSKRAVKMIREGLYSLLKALKMLFCTPENMSKEEAEHECTKLIASGLIVTGGIAIEEALQKALASIPVVNIFSDILSTVILGIVTGLSMSFVVYLIDKIDFFKVNVGKKDEYIANELNEMINKDLEEYDDAYNYVASTLSI